ncbi:MAG: protein translocase subunit SecF, partial [Pseudolysinimonas sp.]
MASGITKFGNDLYTGERSVPFIRLRRIWLTIAAVLMLAAVAVPFVRGGGDFGAGFNFGIEFRGGSQFQVSDASSVKTEPAE